MGRNPWRTSVSIFVCFVEKAGDELPMAVLYGEELQAQYLRKRCLASSSRNRTRVAEICSEEEVLEYLHDEEGKLK
jgi:hypothetical protein